MAEGQVRSVLEKEVTCPLCLGLFKEPKKLPCDHVYCKDCLSGMALRSHNATITCPECRDLAQIPNNNVSNFPTAFHMNRILEVFQQMQMASQDQTGSPSTFGHCQAHSTQLLVIYCTTCKKKLCRDCVLRTQYHASHKYGFFKEVANEYRKQITGNFESLTNQESSLSKAFEYVRATQKEITGHEKHSKKEIDAMFEELHSVLQKRKEEMTKEAEHHYQSISGVSKYHEDQLEEALRELKTLSATVDNCLQDDDTIMLTNVDSTLTAISNAHKKLQTIPLSVTKPQPLIPQCISAEAFQRYLRSECFVQRPAASPNSEDLSVFNLVKKDSQTTNSASNVHINTSSDLEVIQPTSEMFRQHRQTRMVPPVKKCELKPSVAQDVCNDVSSAKMSWKIDQPTIDLQQRLVTLVSYIKEYEPRLSEALVNVVRIKADMDAEARLRRLQVDAAFDGKIELLQSKRQQIQKKILDEFRMKNNAIEQQEEQLVSSYSDLTDIVSESTSSLGGQHNMENLQRKFAKLQILAQNLQQLPTHPVVAANIGTAFTKGDLVNTCCKQCAFRYRIPDINLCKMSREFFQPIETDKAHHFNLKLVDSTEEACPGINKIDVELVCIRDRCKILGTVSKSSTGPGEYDVQIFMRARGRHSLYIRVNSILLPRCPFDRFIQKDPKTLGTPVNNISYSNGPTGLHVFDNNLVVSEESTFTVSVFNTQSGRNTLTLQQVGGQAAVDRDSRCYFVANRISCQLHKFEADGTCVKQMGIQGSEPGLLLNPTGMCFHDHELYVVDSGNNRIQVFDRELNLLRHFGKEGTNNGYFNSPTDLAIDEDGVLYITDTLNNRLQVMNRKGKFIRNIKKIGKLDGYLHKPRRIDHFRGCIYVTEYQRNGVTVFNKTGEYITSFGQEHLINPEGIAIDSDGYVYVTSNMKIIVVF